MNRELALTLCALNAASVAYWIRHKEYAFAAYTAIITIACVYYFVTGTP